MHLETLRLFCYVVETKSFSVAAEKHGVTQSSASQTFAHLEKQWGVKLAVRGPDGITQITPAGHACYLFARDIVRSAGLMQLAMRRSREAADTDIQLAACHSIGLHQLPPFLGRFSAQCPDIRIHLRYGLIDRVHRDVLGNEVDLGLVCYPRRLPGLAVDLFRHERLMLVCHPSHPLAARASVALAELRGETFAAWNEIHWSPFLNRIPDWQRQWYEPLHEFDQVEMVKGVVQNGGCVAILPESTVLAGVAAGKLAAVPLAGGGYTEPLGVIYRRAKKLTPAMKTFIAALKQSTPACN